MCISRPYFSLIAVISSIYERVRMCKFLAYQLQLEGHSEHWRDFPPSIKRVP